MTPAAKFSTTTSARAHEPEEQRLALRVLEVEDHRFLVRVEHDERVGLDVALAAADDVALGRLDLQDARAHEAQQQAAVRAVVHLAQVEHEHAFERALGVRGHGRRGVIAQRAPADITGARRRMR